MSYSWEMRDVRKKCQANVDRSGNSLSPLYLKIGNGRFDGSVGRLVKFSIEPSGRFTKAFAFVKFEPEGRSYKIEVHDGYMSNHMVIPDALTDADLLRIDDKAADIEIPKVYDRYGTPVEIGTMAVILTHGGLKVGTLKKITPKGTLTFKDFDTKDSTFSKSVPVSDRPCVEILVLQKDIMDQMMLRKLSR